MDIKTRDGNGSNDGGVKVELDPVTRIKRDILKSASLPSAMGARFIVDSYYNTQDQRKRFANQLKALAEEGEPVEVLEYLHTESSVLENQMKRALAAYVKHHPDGIGEWLLSIVGIGEVLAAGLLSHIDITRCPTVGHIWSFGGYDPSVEWIGKTGSEKLVHEVIGDEKVVTQEHIVRLASAVNRKPDNIRNLLEIERVTVKKCNEGFSASELSGEDVNSVLSLLKTGRLQVVQYMKLHCGLTEEFINSLPDLKSKPTKDVKRVVAMVLNAAIFDCHVGKGVNGVAPRRLFSADVFRDISLSGLAANLIGRSLPRNKHLYLNRLLVEDVFMIRRVYTKHHAETAMARRPWNDKLKVLFWKCGESFVKQQNNDADVYGKLFVARKAYEWKKNLAGDYAPHAERALSRKKFDKAGGAYAWYAGCYKLDAQPIKDSEYDRGEPGSGVCMLPPGEIHERSKRYATKIFLSHVHNVWYRLHNGVEAPKPFAIAIMDHTHEIEIPNKHLVGVIEDAKRMKVANTNGSLEA